MRTKNAPYCGFPQVISTLRWKVLQSPSKTGGIQIKNYEKHCFGVEESDRCRKCDKVGEKIKHVIVGCSSLSASTYLRRHNKLATIIRQQTPIGYKTKILCHTTDTSQKWCWNQLTQFYTGVGPS
jgi:hypothetical protein